MVARSPDRWQAQGCPLGTKADLHPANRSDWKAELARAFTDADQLLDWLGIRPAQIRPPILTHNAFPLLVPPQMAQQMQRGDPDDPLLRQVLSVGSETMATPGYHRDPVGDENARIAPGLLQKYRGRALLIATSACAVHCRYCFRRHQKLGDGQAQQERLDAALTALANSDEIEEVILSGGDPLLLEDGSLDALIAALEDLPSLKRLRIHSRVPTMLPSRLTPGLCGRLGSSRLRPVLVAHVNHPAEMSVAAIDAFHRLADQGVMLLSQSVLLRGINDSTAVLARLSEQLFAARVVPYYLHLLDPVSGAAHFNVPETEATWLMSQLRDQLPGYLVPRLARERPGASAKTIIC